MRSKHTIRSLLLLLAFLTIPAAAGGRASMYGRAWTFVLDMEPGRTLLGIALFSVLPALYVCAVLTGLLELGRWGRYRVRRRRVGRGLCWRCRYPNPHADPESLSRAQANVCTECGSHPTRLPDYRYFSLRAMAAIALLTIAAAMLAGLLADLYVTAEDLRFIEEVRRQGGQHASYRDRAWPNRGFGFVYLPGHGFTISD